MPISLADTFTDVAKGKEGLYLRDKRIRSYPESNRGRPDVLHHDVMSIRTGSDNRYTIKPFSIGGLNSLD
jgi:hypothetical protein